MSTALTLSAALRARLDGLAPWLAPLGLRLILAYEFGEAGLEKLHGENWFARVMDKFPPPFSWIDTDLSWFMATWVELGAAAALVLGLGTRLAAYSLLVLTFVAVAAVHWPAEWSNLAQLWQGYEIRNMGFGNFKLPLLFVLMLLPLVLGGGGRLSLDALIAQKLPQTSEARADRAAWAALGLGLGLPLAILFPSFGLALMLLGGVLLAASARTLAREISAGVG
ncbi:DoxX family protein [Aquimonas voraii]|uniref:Putative oxidoreductase n=1 Tax=Aquimonas voraii TaxID=265719 RepID=A0A1G7AD45_9GAMM|nr:DoxX family protein [Aquimonas voraii]SDE11945.1 putative oxidoreductase [Aquimonas voraii]